MNELEILTAIQKRLENIANIIHGRKEKGDGESPKPIEEGKGNGSTK
jgi:hypothetical protein